MLQKVLTFKQPVWVAA